MKITYTSGFLDKLSIPDYPLKGFWFQLVNSNQQLNVKESWRSSGSDIYYSNTFVYDTKFRINIKLINENDINNSNNRLYLYALDLFRYQDITELTNTSTNVRNNELLSQLAAIINLDERPDWSISNIMEFNVNKKIKCSFDCVTSIGSDHVKHYVSSDIGSTNYYQVNSNSELIDLVSAQSRLREVMTRVRPDELLGTMTIKDSGIIQL